VKYDIRVNESQEDIEFLCESCFQNAKSIGAIQYTSLIEQNPDKNEGEVYELFRSEMLESFDFTRKDCRVYIIDYDKVPIGYIWVAIRDSEDPWDMDRPLWIFDIFVQSEYRRKGLAKQLLQQAEDFAKELGRNIGLFVHAHNTGAIRLYESSGYEVKTTPISWKFEENDKIMNSFPEYRVRQPVKEDNQIIWNMGLTAFERLVRYSTDVSDEIIFKKYQSIQQEYDLQSGKYMRYIISDSRDEIVAFILMGVAYFSEGVSLVYDLAIKEGEKNSDLQKLLLEMFKKWSIDNELSTAYILLHSENDISIDVCKEMEFKILGYFMEKRLR